LKTNSFKAKEFTSVFFVRHELLGAESRDGGYGRTCYVLGDRSMRAVTLNHQSLRIFWNILETTWTSANGKGINYPAPRSGEKNDEGSSTS
jgi:hypothetical protein